MKRAAKLTAKIFGYYLLAALLAEWMFPRDRVGVSWAEIIRREAIVILGMCAVIFCLSWTCFRIYADFASPGKTTGKKSS